jgi:VIT1/CCC1 family predicted Fe2+/Mn2+ transporter
MSRIISASIVSPITQGAQTAMKNIDDRIHSLEKRLFRKLSSLVIIGFGVILLVFSFFFFLTTYLHWGNATALFSLGITVFVMGLLLKLGETHS